MRQIIYWIYAFCSICAFNIKLKRTNLTYMYKKYSSNYEAIPVVAYLSYSEKDTTKLSDKICLWATVCEQVCRFLPFDAKCAHQSFFLYKIIRGKYGIPVSLVIGVCPYPFSAHAWLMLGDENIFEEEYETSRYNVMLRSDNFHEVGQVECQ